MWGCNGGYTFGNWHWFWGHGIIGPLFSVLLIILFVFLIVYIIRHIFAKSGIDQDKSDFLQILKTKYAAGEISAEEYRRMRQILIN